ncbi:hypothetical protein [Chelativorans salis]|uniref:DUF4175 domain-containing protein n=1 Tax=Chelativorans salis TaxID=2978478 RepID=A0ABT2LQJ2_9HYPH|nr:hypothetical protein [Chelativorans sp. EGI FJ00035]MCT7376349.1 hypothetical protein [Chelativorans sp. EGI FJ00035]
MMILSILLGIVAIGFCCWLLFTLAIFALPAFAGVAIGLWAYHADAGVAGGIAFGAIAAFLTLVVLQAGLMFARPLWVRVALALAFVVPAAIAWFHATHGIVEHAVPSPVWQFVFSLVGSLAVGITAYIRLTALAAAAAQGQSIARA